MTDPMSPAPSAIRANPMGIEEVKAPEPDYGAPLTPLDALLSGERLPIAIGVFAALVLLFGLAVFL